MEEILGKQFSGGALAKGSHDVHLPLPPSGAAAPRAVLHLLL